MAERTLAELQEALRSKGWKKANFPGGAQDPMLRTLRGQFEAGEEIPPAPVLAPSASEQAPVTPAVATTPEPAEQPAMTQEPEPTADEFITGLKAAGWRRADFEQNPALLTEMKQDFMSTRRVRAKVEPAPEPAPVATAPEVPQTPAPALLKMVTGKTPEEVEADQPAIAGGGGIVPRPPGLPANIPSTAAYVDTTLRSRPVVNKGWFTRWAARFAGQTAREVGGALPARFKEAEERARFGEAGGLRQPLGAKPRTLAEVPPAVTERFVPEEQRFVEAANPAAPAGSTEKRGNLERRKELLAKDYEGPTAALAAQMAGREHQKKMEEARLPFTGRLERSAKEVVLGIADIAANVLALPESKEQAKQPTDYLEIYDAERNRELVLPQVASQLLGGSVDMVDFSEPGRVLSMINERPTEFALSLVDPLRVALRRVLPGAKLRLAKARANAGEEAAARAAENIRERMRDTTPAPDGVRTIDIDASEVVAAADNDPVVVHYEQELSRLQKLGKAVEDFTDRLSESGRAGKTTVAALDAARNAGRRLHTAAVRASNDTAKGRDLASSWAQEELIRGAERLMGMSESMANRLQIVIKTVDGKEHFVSSGMRRLAQEPLRKAQAPKEIPASGRSEAAEFLTPEAARRIQAAAEQAARETPGAPDARGVGDAATELEVNRQMAEVGAFEDKVKTFRDVVYRESERVQRDLDSVTAPEQLAGMQERLQDLKDRLTNALDARERGVQDVIYPEAYAGVDQALLDASKEFDAARRKFNKVQQRMAQEAQATVPVPDVAPLPRMRLRPAGEPPVAGAAATDRPTLLFSRDRAYQHLLPGELSEVLPAAADFLQSTAGKDVLQAARKGRAQDLPLRTLLENEHALLPYLKADAEARLRTPGREPSGRARWYRETDIRRATDGVLDYLRRRADGVDHETAAQQAMSGYLAEYERTTPTKKFPTESDTLMLKQKLEDALADPEAELGVSTGVDGAEQALRMYQGWEQHSVPTVEGGVSEQLLQARQRAVADLEQHLKYEPQSFDPETGTRVGRPNELLEAMSADSPQIWKADEVIRRVRRGDAEMLKQVEDAVERLSRTRSGDVAQEAADALGAVRRIREAYSVRRVAEAGGEQTLAALTEPVRRQATYEFLDRASRGDLPEGLPPETIDRIRDIAQDAATEIDEVRNLLAREGERVPRQTRMSRIWYDDDPELWTMADEAAKSIEAEVRAAGQELQGSPADFDALLAAYAEKRGGLVPRGLRDAAEDLRKFDRRRRAEAAAADEDIPPLDSYLDALDREAAQGASHPGLGSVQAVDETLSGFNVADVGDLQKLDLYRLTRLREALEQYQPQFVQRWLDAIEAERLRQVDGSPAMADIAAAEQGAARGVEQLLEGAPLEMAAEAPKTVGALLVDVAKEEISRTFQKVRNAFEAAGAPARGSVTVDGVVVPGPVVRATLDAERALASLPWADARGTVLPLVRQIEKAYAEAGKTLMPRTAEAGRLARAYEASGRPLALPDAETFRKALADVTAEYNALDPTRPIPDAAERVLAFAHPEVQAAWAQTGSKTLPSLMDLPLEDLQAAAERLRATPDAPELPAIEAEIARRSTAPLEASAVAAPDRLRGVLKEYDLKRRGDVETLSMDQARNLATRLAEIESKGARGWERAVQRYMESGGLTAKKLGVNQALRRVGVETPSDLDVLRPEQLAGLRHTLEVAKDASDARRAARPLPEGVPPRAPSEAEFWLARVDYAQQKQAATAALNKMASGMAAGAELPRILRKFHVLSEPADLARLSSADLDRLGSMISGNPLLGPEVQPWMEGIARTRQLFGAKRGAGAGPLFEREYASAVDAEPVVDVLERYRRPSPLLETGVAQAREADWVLAQLQESGLFDVALQDEIAGARARLGVVLRDLSPAERSTPPRLPQSVRGALADLDRLRGTDPELVVIAQELIREVPKSGPRRAPSIAEVEAGAVAEGFPAGVVERVAKAEDIARSLAQKAENIERAARRPQTLPIRGTDQARLLGELLDLGEQASASAERLRQQWIRRVSESLTARYPDWFEPMREQLLSEGYRLRGGEAEAVLFSDDFSPGDFAEAVTVGEPRPARAYQMEMFEKDVPETGAVAELPVGEFEIGPEGNLTLRRASSTTREQARDMLREAGVNEKYIEDWLQANQEFVLSGDIYGRMMQMLEKPKSLYERAFKMTPEQARAEKLKIQKRYIDAANKIHAVRSKQKARLRKKRMDDPYTVLNMSEETKAVFDTFAESGPVLVEDYRQALALALDPTRAEIMGNPSVRQAAIVRFLEEATADADVKAAMEASPKEALRYMETLGKSLDAQLKAAADDGYNVVVDLNATRNHWTPGESELQRMPRRVNFMDRYVREALLSAEDGPELRRAIQQEALAYAADRVGREIRKTVFDDTLIGALMRTVPEEAVRAGRQVEATALSAWETTPQAFAGYTPEALGVTPGEVIGTLEKLAREGKLPGYDAPGGKRRLKYLTKRLHEYRSVYFNSDIERPDFHLAGVDRNTYANRQQALKARMQTHEHLWVPKELLQSMEAVQRVMDRMNSRSLYAVLERSVKANKTVRGIQYPLSNGFSNDLFDLITHADPLRIITKYQRLTEYYLRTLRGVDFGPAKNEIYDAIWRMQITGSDVAAGELGGRKRFGLPDFVKASSRAQEVPVPRWMKRVIAQSERMTTKGLRGIELANASIDDLNKVSEAYTSMVKLTEGFRLMDVGSAVEFPTSKSLFTTVVRMPDDFSKSGFGRVDPLSGTVHPLSTRQLHDLAGLFGRYRSGQRYVNFTDIGLYGLYLKAMRGNPGFSMFYTWFSQGLDIPGVKKGYFSAMLSPSMEIRTSSPAFARMLARDTAALTLRRLLMVRLAMSQQQDPDMQDALRSAGVGKYDYGKNPPLLVSSTSADGIVGILNLARASFLAPTEVLLRAAQAGIDFVTGNDLPTPEEWPKLWPTDPATGTLDVNLVTVEDEDERERILDQRAQVERVLSGETADAGDFLEVFGMRGSPFLDPLLKVMSAEDAGRPTPTASEVVAEAVLQLGVANVVASALKVAAYASGKDPFGLVDGTEHFARQDPSYIEDKWSVMFRLFTTYGYRPTNLPEARKTQMQRISREFSEKVTRKLKKQMLDLVGKLNDPQFIEDPNSEEAEKMKAQIAAYALALTESKKALAKVLTDTYVDLDKVIAKEVDYKQDDPNPRTPERRDGEMARIQSRIDVRRRLLEKLLVTSPRSESIGRLRIDIADDEQKLQDLSNSRGTP